MYILRKLDLKINVGFSFIRFYLNIFYLLSVFSVVVEWFWLFESRIWESNLIFKRINIWKVLVL